MKKEEWRKEKLSSKTKELLKKKKEKTVINEQETKPIGEFIEKK